MSRKYKGIRDYILNKLRENICFESGTDGFYNSRNIEDCEEEVNFELSKYGEACKFSVLFYSQLIELHSKGYVEIDDNRYLYHPKYIYDKISQIIEDAKKARIKLFNKTQSVLQGKNIYHIHHNQINHLEKNHIRYIERKYPDDLSIERRLNELIKLYPEQNPVSIFVYEALMETVEWKGKTGEWIVFQKKDDIYNFLCLANHIPKTDKRDTSLFQKIENYLI